MQTHPYPHILCAMPKARSNMTPEERTAHNALRESRRKARMATDPAYAERQRARRRLLEKRYLSGPVDGMTRRRRKKLRVAYGLTTEEFHTLAAAQHGRCAICAQALSTDVDHDHATGAVRGLLCSPCNVGIGHLADPARLRAAAAYLENPPAPEILTLLR